MYFFIMLLLFDGNFDYFDEYPAILFGDNRPHLSVSHGLSSWSYIIYIYIYILLFIPSVAIYIMLVTYK